MRWTAIVMAILVAASGASAQQRTQVLFKEPSGMKVFWLTKVDGKAAFSTTPLEAPGRFNFLQGAVYRLKLTHLAGRPGLELFPTLDVPPASPATREFLGHNSVPVVLTDDEIEQVVKGNLLVKVVYLPNAAGDEIAPTSGPDAVREAQRRGHIVLVLRIGNIDFTPK
jgi:hypothetical protein